MMIITNDRVHKKNINSKPFSSTFQGPFKDQVISSRPLAMTVILKGKLY